MPADGQVRDYKIEKLPTNMAVHLARQWLRKGDPTSKVVIGTFLAVDPKGDQQACAAASCCKRPPTRVRTSPRPC